MRELSCEEKKRKRRREEIGQTKKRKLEKELEERREGKKTQGN